MEPNNRDAVSIPYFVHEGDIDRVERANRRLIVALILTIILMFATNAIWLYEWMQYDYFGYDEETITTSYEQDGFGINVMGNHNEVNNGTESEDNSDKAEYENPNPEIIPGK